MTIEMVETNPTKIRWFSICKRLPEGNILLLCFVSEGYLLSCWSGSEPGWGSWGWVSTKIGCPWLPEIGEWSCSKTYFSQQGGHVFFALPDVHHLFRHTQICGKKHRHLHVIFSLLKKESGTGIATLARMCMWQCSDIWDLWKFGSLTRGVLIFFGWPIYDS